MALIGKTAIITGASRGIGAALSIALAKQGANIVVAAKSIEHQEHLEGTIFSVASKVEENGGKALPFQLDVQNEIRIKDMVKVTLKEFGPPQILINNASALWWKSIENTPMKRFDRIHSINARATFACIKECLPFMRESGWGHIVTHSPPILLDKMAGMTAYNMSKFGMTLAALGAAQEYAGVVASNTIWPTTLIDTAATRNHNIGKLQDWRKPTIITDAITEILKENPANFTNNMLLDEPYLRSKGINDFEKYQCVPGVEPPPIFEVLHKITY